MQPLNKTPMGLIDFLQDFYAKYCVGQNETTDT